ncbi:phosphoglucomutase/phosphomannomutase PgmG [Sphingomonas rubra]|uniref:Phosphomannomutase n=1 Tax=Sphingomonas rubra TaxID=634430 RepID=A0A1I5RA56_9SPHN|nr:phosphomannomutase/phosphoglucomutase [Sphingomonas rubra]SFP54896.1 phosphomannomutase [Sphingomonas rubra]
MSHRFHRSVLREYDIRGIVGRTLGEDDAVAVGRGFATRVRQAGGSRVAVGRDGRTTSPMLEAALVRGLTAGGVDAVRIGVGPSPMLYYAEATLGVDGGIQVTGSHNPADHNGFKMVLGHRSFWSADIAGLAALGPAGDWSEGTGAVTDADVLPAYVERLMRGYDGGAFRIGWDCGSGAAGPAVEALCARLPGEHHLLFTTPDGNFPHHHPDPSDEANLADLKRLVADERLDFGLAFDGDGDRIGVVDARGRVLWGDQILMLLAEPLLAELPGATIIADVKASAALFDRVAALGGHAVMARTGHSAIKTRMVECGAPLAGEMSGHIFFGQHYYGFDDALYAAVRLIRAVHLAGRSLAELVDAMPVLVSTPDLRIPVDETRKLAVVEEVRARLTQAGARVDDTDGVRVTTADGWWLLRSSNTQGAVTVRAEGSDQPALDRLLAEVDAALAASGVRR